ncbi:hypothetical protein [Amycolatopsis sp. NPDC051128]|uniref:hypothetical protein n=1 Tax=Amycolatopsis sp. NPDC051128 TaxID=3155412 RepID=UPI0034332ECC
MPFTAKTGRKRVAVVAGAVMILGWTLVAHFWIQPLLPAPVVAGVLLGGITLGILLTAVIGGRAKKAPESDDRRPPADL